MKITNEFISQIAEVVVQLPNDLRMEVVAAYLINNGINPKDILISPMGLFQRSYSRDLDRISLLEVGSGKEYIHLETNREGIYDALPEAISHSNPTKKGNGVKTVKEMVAEVKVRKKEEASARLFFKPFENEFLHQNVHLEIEEQNILKGFSSNSGYLELLQKFWDLPEFLDTRQKAISLYLIPIVHKIACDYELVKIVYVAILGLNVNFKIKRGKSTKLPNTFKLGEGGFKLGLSSICGNQYFDFKQYIEISVQPANEAELIPFLPGGNSLKILEYLNETYLPFEMEKVFRIKTDSLVKPIKLESVGQGSLLGFTSYL